MTERPSDQSRADKPRASYEPLTEGRIGEIKSVILADRENWPSKAYGREIDVLCAMAVNSLLYAEEIERLRTRSAVVASDLTKLDVMKLYDEAFESTFPTLHGEPPTVPVLQVMALREFARRLVGTPRSASGDRNGR